MAACANSKRPAIVTKYTTVRQIPAHATMRSTSSVLPVPADAKMAMSSSILFATKYRLATPSNKSMTTKRTNANATKNSTGSTQQGLVNANFTERDGECVAKPICDEQKEIYDATSNTCKCNVAAHWTGSAGSCTCAEGMSLCKGACVDVNTDVDHCGACSSPCSLSNECIGGKCLGPSNCNGGNHNTKDSIDHCGRCGNRCDDGTTCILGECVVGDGYTYCNGEKVRLNTPSHCNSCEPCSDGLICENNECLEGQGKMVCNNRVIDSRNDSANCSRCGNVCAQGLKCVDSECVRIDDITTSITCDGTTVNPSNDRLNCGGCGIYCLKCVNGACTQLNEGDTLYLGVYEGKPIQWQVIDKQIDMDSTDGYKYLVGTTKPL